MHLLKAQTATPEDAGEAIDLAQTPGDIVVLSAADTELACLAAAQARRPPDAPEPASREPSPARPSDVGRPVRRAGRGAGAPGDPAPPRRPQLLALWARAGGGRLPGGRNRFGRFARRRPAGPRAARLEHAAPRCLPSALAISGARRAGQRRPAPRLRRRSAGPERGMAGAGAAPARRPVLAGPVEPGSRWRAGALARGPPGRRPRVLPGLGAGGRPRGRRCPDRRARRSGAERAAGLCRQPQGPHRRAAGPRVVRAGGAGGGAERDRFCRLEPGGVAPHALGPAGSPRASGRALRRQRGGVAGRHARPVGARSGDERRPARGRRPGARPRGRVQGAKALRSRDRDQHRGLRSGRRPGPVHGAAGGRLGAARRHPGRPAAGRDRARQLSQSRRPDRQRRRPGHAGEHGAAARGLARGRLSDRGAARGRPGPGRGPSRRRHQ